MPTDDRPKFPRVVTPSPVPRQDPRDFAGPKTNPHGVPTAFSADEKTEVNTDVQVFRAVKGLHARITESEQAAAKSHGELKTEVNGLREDVQGLAVGQATTAGKLDVLLAMQRSRSPSSDARTAAEQTMAKQILDDDLDRRRSNRKFWLIVAGGVFSSGVVGALVHAALTGRL